MRVLLISHTCQSRTEGQPKARRLAKIPGVELKVLIPNRWQHYGKARTPDPVPPEEFAAILGKTMWPWVGPAQFYLHWYPEMASILREFRPDIIDLWEEPWGLVSVQACRLRNKLLPNCKIVMETEQNIDKHLPFPFERFRSLTIRNADFAVGRNSESIEILRKKGWSKSAQVVPNAVDTALFRPLDRAACRNKLGFRGFVCGYVGRLVEEKGLMDLVEALPHCNAEVNAVFVGSGPYLSALQERVKSINLADRVKFIPAVPLESLPEIMNAMDVLVLPSRTTPSWKEQFGRVIIEANACGTPVIGSNSGAIPDVVGDGGLIFQEGSAKDLAEKIETLCVSPEANLAMGRRGMEAALENYTWESVANRMYRIYLDILASTNMRETTE